VMPTQIVSRISANIDPAFALSQSPCSLVGFAYDAILLKLNNTIAEVSGTDFQEYCVQLCE
jgi:hypothetical protein